MLVVETIAKIRRAYFVQGKPIKAICRELRVSRKTVRKVIRSEETAFTYERASQSQPKIGPWRDELDRLLATNAARAVRERLSLTRVFEELRALGYDGGYDAVHSSRGRLEAPGERGCGDGVRAAQLRAGRGLPVRLEPRGRRHRRGDHDREGGPCPALPQPDDARARLPAREPGDGVRRARPRLRPLRRRLHAGHLRQRPLSAIGPRTMGAKTAVDAIFVGRERAYNRRFQQMCSHYLVEPVACTPASGWEKGQVERPAWARSASASSRRG